MKKLVIGMILSACLLLAGIIMSYYGIAPDNYTFLISISVAIFMTTIVAYNKRRHNEKPDERDIKITMMASNYSWSFTYLLIAVLILVDHFRLFILNVQSVLSMVFFSMIAVQLLIITYLSKKGEL